MVYVSKTFVKVFEVLKHILGSSDEATMSTSIPLTPEWLKIDSIVLSWIFMTLFETLQARLISLKLGDFSIDAYFCKIESIPTILTSLGSPISNDDVVTIALEGLPDKYENVFGVILHREPFLDLKTVRSMLTTEEMTLKSRSQALHIDSLSYSPTILLAKSGNDYRSNVAQVKSSRPCFNFAKGSCHFGDTCKFVYNSFMNENPPNNTSLWSPNVNHSTSSPSLRSRYPQNLNQEQMRALIQTQHALLPNLDDYQNGAVAEDRTCVTRVTPLSDFNEDECFNPGGDVDEIEFLLRRDPSTPKMSVVSIIEGFTDEPPLEENDDLFDLEYKANDWKKILYDAPIDDLMTEDKVFDHNIHKKNFSPTYVSLSLEDRHYLSSTYVIRTFLPYFTYPVNSSLPLSFGSEDIIFDPDIFTFHFSSLEPVAYECPMEVCSSTCFIPNIMMILGESS
ncbi:replication protein A 70 kDa DNA-binding subunit B [Tanacetum coccineum]